MTLVATRTSNRFARNQPLLMLSVLASYVHEEGRDGKLRDAHSPSDSNAEDMLAVSRPDSSTVGTTTYPLTSFFQFLPKESPTIDLPGLAGHDTLPTSCRPGGNSSMTDISKSP
jgi:hypothetical protein